MALSEAEYLLKLWQENICPCCGKLIPEGTRVGSGRKAEGGFCSLGCYARYYQTELRDRAQNLAKIAAKRRSQDSGEPSDE